MSEPDKLEMKPVMDGKSGAMPLEATEWMADGGSMLLSFLNWMQQ